MKTSLWTLRPAARPTAPAIKSELAAKGWYL